MYSGIFISDERSTTNLKSFQIWSLSILENSKNHISNNCIIEEEKLVSMVGDTPCIKMFCFISNCLKLNIPASIFLPREIILFTGTSFKSLRLFIFYSLMILYLPIPLLMVFHFPLINLFAKQIYSTVEPMLNVQKFRSRIGII